MSVDVEEQTARAKLLIAQRQYQEAVRACRRVLLTYPDRADVRLLLGQAMLALGRFDEVRAEMLALAREAPGLAAVQRVLGEAFLRSGQVNRAREYLERARALDPSDTAAVELIAELDGEEPGVSSTVERWFDPEAVATIQTNPPGYEEENTGQLVIGGAGGVRSLASSSVQVDPALGARVISSPIPSVATRRALPSAPAHALLSAPAPDDWDDETSEDDSIVPEKTVARPGRRAAAPAAAARAPAAPAATPPRADGTSQLDISEIEQVEGISGEQQLLEVDDDSADDELEGEATVARVPAATAEREPPPAARPAAVTPYPPPAAAARPRTLPPSPPAPPRSAPPPAPPPSQRGAPAGADAGSAFPNDPIPLPPTAASAAVAPLSPFPPLTPAAPSPFPARTMTLPGYAEPPIPGPPPPGPTPTASPFPSAAPLGPPGPPAPPGVSPMPATRLAIAAPAMGDRPDTSRIQTKRVPMALIAAGAAALLLIVGVSAFFGVRSYLRGRELDQIHAAADAACDEGSKGALESASELASKRTSEPEVAALRARLLAIATFEHAADHSAEVGTLLAPLATTTPPLVDAQIASIYSRLARGDAGGARTEASTIVTEGEPAAEAARARAIASTALGQLPQALVEARTAAQLRPGSPRHTALLALLTAQSGNVPTARTLLDTVPNGERSPAVHVARARILVDVQGESARAASEAETVLGALASVASPPERAWAQLVRARVAVDGGDSTNALLQARQAAQAKPRLDEAFGLLLGETLLRSGAPSEARAALTALPPASLAGPRRALLTAEVALALGDLPTAEAALPQAGDGPRVEMIRGRVLEARGQTDLAIQAYRRAAADPVLAVRAKVRLGALHLAAGRAREAAQLLDEARAIAPADTELVPLEVRALVRINQLESADIVVRDALARRADAPEFLAARASVQLARGDVPGALAALRTAAGVRPNDADIQASLGDAARRAGEREEAKRAFNAALVISASQPIALSGLAILAAESGDAAATRTAIERATQAGAGGPELAQARLRLAILEGAGESAIAEGRTLAQQVNDSATWSGLGRLQLQAEHDRDAADSFRRALEIDARDPEALLGRGLIAIRNGDLGGAASRLEAATAAAAERHGGADLEARILSARGRLRFEYGTFGDAMARAREAIAKDARCADAHLLLANVAIETGGDPIPELRAAVAGTSPPPEAVGRLAVRLPAGQEACDFAARYMRSAPQGYDADSVRAVQSRCGR